SGRADDGEVNSRLLKPLSNLIRFDTVERKMASANLTFRPHKKLIPVDIKFQSREFVSYFETLTSRGARVIPVRRRRRLGRSGTCPTSSGLRLEFLQQLF